MGQCVLAESYELVVTGSTLDHVAASEGIRHFGPLGPCPLEGAKLRVEARGIYLPTEETVVVAFRVVDDSGQPLWTKQKDQWESRTVMCAAALSVAQSMRGAMALVDRYLELVFGWRDDGSLDVWCPPKDLRPGIDSEYVHDRDAKLVCTGNTTVKSVIVNGGVAPLPVSVRMGDVIELELEPD